MYTIEEIDDLKQKSSRWKEIIPKIISTIQDQELRTSFNVLLEDWKKFEIDSIRGVLDYSQSNLRQNVLTVSYINLCDQLPIKKKQQMRKNLFKLLEEYLISNKVGEAIQLMRDVLDPIKTSDSIDFQRDLLLLQTRANRFMEEHAKGFDPSDSSLNRIKDSALKYFKAIQTDSKITNQIDLFTIRGLYDNILCIENTINVNSGVENKLVVNSTTNNITINNNYKPSQAEINSGETLEDIFKIFRSYFQFVQKNSILFPAIAREAKEVANTLIGISFKLVDSFDLSEIDKIKKSLERYESELKSLIQKAEDERNDSKNSEGTQILSLLKEETPTWDDLKKAYGLLKQARKADLFGFFPEEEPLSAFAKRELKQRFFDILK
jgi:hypothetical protein